MDRRRKKKTSNKDWVNPHDRDARVSKMKDGRTHLAHKAEHAVDLDSGAVVAVTLQEADKGDTTTVTETLTQAGEAVAELIRREAETAPAEAPKVNVAGVEELVADKGYHSGAMLAGTREAGVRTYIPERKQTGRRNWRGKDAQRQAVYANRRRVDGDYGKRLLKKRGELVERSFAHCYDTGGMRRTHLRKHDNILKRQLIHVGAFNLSLILRQMLGAGTPRELRNRAAGFLLLIIGVLRALGGLQDRRAELGAERIRPRRSSRPLPAPRCCHRNWRGSTTGC
jgi:transposase